MRFILGALAAVAIAGVAFVQPAEARCFWNGFETVCVHHGFGPYGFYRHHMYRDWDRDRPYYRGWY
jgi:hypothetical protein